MNIFKKCRVRTALLQKTHQQVGRISLVLAADFPKAEITSAEKVRRAMAEAKRLASLAPGEWRLWIDRAAERLGVPRATLEGLISAIIKVSERKAREDKVEARRQEEGPSGRTPLPSQRRPSGNRPAGLLPAGSLKS